MGNTQGLPWNRNINTSDASAMFHELDVEGRGFLTLKDLMGATASGLMMPHSLPALYFFDQAQDGRLVHSEFVALVAFCHEEKRKVEEAFAHDKAFRDLILRASRAGVKDCSSHGRSSFRRFSSYSNVRSVFSSRNHPSPAAAAAAAATDSFPDSPTPSRDIPPRHSSAAAAARDKPIISRSPSDSSEEAGAFLTQDSTSSSQEHSEGSRNPHSALLSSESSFSSDTEDAANEATNSSAQDLRTIAMYSSQREFDPVTTGAAGDGRDGSHDVHDPRNRTALDAAVLENIMHANIHKLADLLHTEGSREKFMSWLWNLADLNSSGVVTLEELRVFLAALSADGIDLEELVFYKEAGVPLEECIINEFDTSHGGLLSRDEFMVLADLVTREYEFWENRHLERIGDYELSRTIGRGSSGVVRLAIHVETRRKVAIKIIKKGKCSDLSRLDREIQSLKAARHTHVVALDEVLDSESNLFLVMELCGGGSMVDIVRVYPEERMPEESARFFMRQVFEALAFCHRNGICHRDVRLDNLMLDNSGNVKITDFGHSGIYTPGWDLFSTSLVGSVYNLSPEQLTGQVYSGEKIDIWSAGVAVYCLLVGRPPFFEPEVTPLLERITACDFEMPDFLSAKAKDLLHCMIRAVPEERITMEQMLHHPWFYDGPEFGPSMNVVVIPVDPFFKKRPDIAEMIMAITIYQHNLHFHLADAQNPTSSPEDQRGQNWTLKCWCPKNDIKFAVSLFTREPRVRKIVRRKRRNSTLTSMSYQGLPELAGVRRGPAPSASTSTLPELAQDANASPTSPIPRTRSKDIQSVGRSEMKRSEKSLRSAAQLQGTGLGGTGKLNNSGLGKAPLPPAGFSRSKPPLHRQLMKITPLAVAAHIREHPNEASESFPYQDYFDFESDGHSRDFAAESGRDASPLKGFAGGKAVGAADPAAQEARRAATGRHSRSHSVDGSGNLVRINRSATVDAFPYQKVYPQRTMPDSARKLNFDLPEAPSLDPHESDVDGGEGSEAPPADEATSSPLSHAQRNTTEHVASPLSPELSSRSSQSTILDADGGITEELCRHPSKVIYPQSPQMLPHNDPSPESIADAAEDLALTAAWRDVVSEEPGMSRLHLSIPGDLAETEAQDAFQPYIEVRLQRGESGLFLKICRKLKTICTTKLAAAAERQKKKTGGRRSWSTLRRTASAKSLTSNASGGETLPQSRSPAFETRARSGM